MKWQPVDCHAHTTFSDGSLTIAELVERAAALGVYPGVADHVSRDVARTIHSEAGVVAYLDALTAYDMLRGGEFCYHDDLWRELPAPLVRRFTHRVGSLHAIRMRDGSLVRAFARHAPSGLLVDAYMDAHIDYLELFAQEMPVDILAHPTLIALPFRARDLDELWTEQRESRLVDALFAAGIAFEISNRYRPHERLVRRAVDRGVRIALGSDGHTLEQVADLAWPLSLARSLGVRDGDLYDPRRHGSRTQAIAE
jgi:histidinol phosphatase-like PHP family hydrolase